MTFQTSVKQPWRCELSLSERDCMEQPWLATARSPVCTCRALVDDGFGHRPAWAKRGRRQGWWSVFRLPRIARWSAFSGPSGGGPVAWTRHVCEGPLKDFVPHGLILFKISLLSNTTNKRYNFSILRKICD